MWPVLRSSWMTPTRDWLMTEVGPPDWPTTALPLDRSLMIKPVSFRTPDACAQPTGEIDIRGLRRWFNKSAVRTLAAPGRRTGGGGSIMLRSAFGPMLSRRRNDHASDAVPATE